MRIEEIAQNIGINLLTEGPNFPATEIIVNNETVTLKPQNYTPQEGDEIYLFSQNNGTVTIYKIS